MESKEFLTEMQRYVAYIPSSTLRNQGASGVVEKAIEFLSAIELSELFTVKPGHYGKWLNKKTEELKSKLPSGARRWGTARKPLNVFMVQVSLNKHLSEAYRIDRLVKAFELPLDYYTSKALLRRATKKALPGWPGVGALNEEVNAEYQKFAAELAKREGLPRPYLDVLFWRADC